MSIEEVLNLYNVKMYSFHKQVSGRLFFDKQFSGGGQMDSFFDLAYNDPNTISLDILPKIKHVVDGNNPPLNEIDNTLGGIDNNAIIYSDAVRFHNPYDGKILQTVPIKHFQIIAEAWRDFLLQPPHIGSLN